MEDLLNRLVTAGYERVAQVTTRGQFAVRGGIVDLYSWQAPLPLRLEFFGDQIESPRQFATDTRTSVRDLGSVDILLGPGAAVPRPPAGPSGGRPSVVRHPTGRSSAYLRPHDLVI